MATLLAEASAEAEQVLKIETATKMFFTGAVKGDDKMEAHSPFDKPLTVRGSCQRVVQQRRYAKLGELGLVVPGMKGLPVTDLHLEGQGQGVGEG